MPVTVSLTASPPSLVANGQTSTITVTVVDYYGVAVPNSIINWTTTDGTINTSQATTNSSGKASVILKSSWTLGGAAVSARTAENDGSSAIWVPFIDSFVAYPSTYTGWANNGGVYSCSGWTPDPSTVASGTWFTQTATCYQNYYRYRQDRQQSIVTGAVTNVGGQVAEYTTGTVGVSQGAVGTKAPPGNPITCTYSSAVNITPDTAAFVTIDPSGAKGVFNAETTYDSIINGNYNAGMGPLNTNVHGTQVWDGYVDYHGYRYTSGAFRETTSEHGTTWYYFELCKQLL